MAEEKLAVQKDNTGGFSGLKIFFSLLLVILLMTAAYFYFIYPTAVIEIEPAVSEVEGSLTLYCSPEISSTDLEKGILPLREMEVEISAEQEITTSGEKIVGEREARGTVKFINEAKNKVTIPEGTILENSGGIRFKTLAEIEVPGLEIDYLMDLPVGMRAGQARVEVVCLEKGTAGNVSVGSINKMIGGPEDIYLINTEPARGGEDKHYQVISQSDRDQLRDKLEDYLKDKLITRFYQESGGSYRIIEDELTFSRPEITYSGEIGDLAGKLKASGSLTARGYVLKNRELNSLVERLFREKLAADNRVLSSEIDINGVVLEKAALVEKLTEQEENLAEYPDRLYNIKVDLLAPVISSFDFEDLINELKGSSVEAAREILEARDDIKRVAININGDRLPGLGFAIKMVVREPVVNKVFAPGG